MGISGADDDVIDFGAPLRVVQLTSPAFTGTLNLTVFRGMGPTARRLLALPNGLRFRELMLTCLHEEDLQWIAALAVGCSDTLERLAVTCHLHSMFVSSSGSTCSSPSFVDDSSPTPIDLPKATKLRNASFVPAFLNVKWITLALQTITPKHRDLRLICIHLPSDRVFTGTSLNARQIIGGGVYSQWLTLDRVLVQLWESRSVRPKITYIPSPEKKEIRELMECLLPEMTKRGIIDLVEWSSDYSR